MHKAIRKTWLVISIIRQGIVSAIILFLLCPAQTTYAGSIVGWGYNWAGQASPPSGNNYIAIAAGGYHSLALQSDGTIVAWGRNDDGEANPPAGNRYIGFSARWLYSLALRSDGSIVGFGSNRDQRGEWSGQAIPPAGNNFVAVAAGGYHSLALRSDGSIVGWGYNYNEGGGWAGQASPPTGNNFIAIVAGGYHSLALKSDGSIVGWGWNGYGQATPPAGNNYIAIAAGLWHSLALRSDGTIVGWGRNEYGQATPPTGNNYIAIAAGWLHNLALRSDGSIAAWGEDSYGGATPPGGNDYITIAAGGGHSLALKAEGPQVTLKRFEINQCFQEVEADGTTQVYDLIETKPFVVRVNLERYSAGTTTANVKLSIFNAATGKQISTTKEEKDRTIKYGSSQPVDFPFKDNETRDMKASDYRFSLVVEDNRGNKLLETNLNYEFKSSKTVRMLVVPVLTWNFVEVSVWNNKYIKFAEQVFPVPKTSATNVNHFEVVPLFPYELSVPVSGIDWRVLVLQMRSWLSSYNKGHLWARADFICAVVPDGTLGEDPGLAWGQAIIIEAQAESENILAHEIGHVYGLGEEYVKTNTRDWRTGLWLLDQTFAFDRNPPPLKLTANGPFIISWLRPYGGQRCDWSDDTDSYVRNEIPEGNTTLFHGWRKVGRGGYDVKNQREVSPDTTTMMGFNDWISGPEYRTLIDSLVLGKHTPQAERLFLESMPVLDSQATMIVSGIVDINDRTAKLSSLIPAPDLELTPEVTEPNCTLKFLSKVGIELGTFKFLPFQSTLPGSCLRGPFWVVADLPSTTVRMQVVIDGTVADELLLTDNSPTVQVVSPNGGEEITREMVISWAASDPDSNNLSYTVEFSSDDGTEWGILTSNYTGTELPIDVNYLPGGNNCLVKVIASDGWNSSEDVSDGTFSVGTKPPKVSILDPEDGAVLLYSQSMQGRCIAYDSETGDITDPNKIVWSSNVDGFLGKGNLVGFKLTLGDHLLSATAADPEGKTATGTVKVSVAAKRSDVNRDLSIDVFDLGMLARKWLQACSEPNWCEGSDLNLSGKIDFDDFAIFAGTWLWKKIVADLDIDDNVGLTDYATLASYWMNENCDKTGWCHGTDLDKSEKVDILDLAIFTDHWLESSTP